MSDKDLPSPELLRQLIRYESDTGKLFWLPRSAEMFPDERAMKSWNTQFAGKPAFFFKETHGYMSGKVFQKNYRAHRIAWALHHGKWPTGHIDHINGNRADNRIENLRDVQRTDNQRNQKLSCRNTSGFCGVSLCKRKKRWRASIRAANGQDLALGTFDTKEEAILARKEAEIKYGYHPNHGKR